MSSELKCGSHMIPFIEVLLNSKGDLSTTCIDGQDPQLSNGTVYLAVNQVLPHSHPTLRIRFGPALPHTIALLNSKRALVPCTVVLQDSKGDLPKYNLH